MSLILRRLKTSIRSHGYDLSVLVAWAAILAVLSAFTFYGRSCNEPPCQAPSYYFFVFIASVGAGLALRDFRFVFLGFLLALPLSVVFFVSLVMAPVWLGISDPFLSDILLSFTLGVALRGLIPIPVILSLLGSVVGAFLSEKYRFERTLGRSVSA